ncbi:MAG: hypothetical protein GX640_14380 [Fibrobacter sp.]|nr:hypothetical protein [Fibrobacter sp.]
MLVLVSCSGESDEFARKKLDSILKDDLTAILEDVPDSALLEKPYYELVDYKTYDKGNYSKKAVADFYFMKNIPVKIVRKYRYHVNTRMWDRYYNEYSFYSDSTDTKKGAQ